MKHYIFLLMLFFSIVVRAQSLILIDSGMIEKFKNKKNLVYKDGDKYYGAGNSLEGENIVIHFDNISYNLSTKTLTLKGATYQTIVEPFSRLNGVKIFLATPFRDRLKNKKTLGYSKTSQTSNDTDGDFSIQFKVNKYTRLYFEGSNVFFLVEYDVPSLIKNLSLPVTIVGTAH